MNYYVITSSACFQYLSLINDDGCLVVSDQITVPKRFLDQFKVIKVKGYDDFNDCKRYTDSFLKLKNNPAYSQSIEPHINGIYEYVVLVINSFVKTLATNLKEDDVIILMGGNRKANFFPSYAINSAELNRNIFFSNSDILNPLIYQAFKGYFKISYREDHVYRVKTRYALRIILYHVIHILKP